MSDKPRYYSYLRFSSAEQEYGDSIRRQTAMAEKWAMKNGVNLDDSLRMEDKGLSAYHQRHLEEDAALGDFMVKLKAGKIPKGSTLIVESNDRLSRAEPKEALFQFMEILKGGCDVVILADKDKLYSWETFDELQMIISIIKASRAHEESKEKARRVSDSWSNKRNLARKEKKPITRRIPAWIRLDESGTFQVIEERAALIRRIFREAINGDGVEMICRRFNREGIPPWGTPHKRNRDNAIPVWNKSYITKILVNGAVHGLYVPSVLIDGKRTPQEAIEDFYPAVIDKITFLKTRESMSSRIIGSGRTGKTTNLFPHLVRCGYCGQNAHHVNKGSGKKTGPHGGEFLACSLARVGKGCEYHGLPYKPFEEAFLQYCSEVDLSALLAQDSRADAIAQAQDDLDAIVGALKEAEFKITGLLATISAVTNSVMAERLAKELDLAGAEQERLAKEREAATMRLEGLQRTGQTVADHVDAIREISAKMEGTDEEERIAIRKRMKHAIARAVERITIFPAGLQGRVIELVDGAIEVIDRKPGLSDAEQAQLFSLLSDKGDFELARDEIINGQEQWFKSHVAATTGKDKAVVLVRFRNGHSRVFRWDADAKVFQQTDAMTGERYESELLTAIFSDGDIFFS